MPPARAVVILVAGATGRVGGRIARELLERGDEVRILVRPASPHQPLVAAGARPVAADLKDPASLARACRGVDAVITTASAGERGGADTPESVDREGNRHLIDAARAAGVRRFVFVSALFADDNAPAPLLRAKAATENHLRASGMAFTILAANGFMDVMLPLIIGGPVQAGRPVTLVGAGARRHSLIAARDVAAFAVAALAHPAAVDQRIPIGGPEPVSWRDAVAAWERALGRTIPVQSIPPGALLPDLPPVPGLAEFLSAQLAFMETFDSPVDMTATARRFGVRQTSLDAWVRAHVQKPVPA